MLTYAAPTNPSNVLIHPFKPFSSSENTTINAEVRLFVLSSPRHATKAVNHLTSHCGNPIQWQTPTPSHRKLHRTALNPSDPVLNPNQLSNHLFRPQVGVSRGRDRQTLAPIGACVNPQHASPCLPRATVSMFPS